jgi:hypothetical protein
METYLLEMNRWCFGSHIPLGCEQVKFGLTHILGCEHLMFILFIFHPFYPFTCFSFLSISIVHPFYFYSMYISQNIPPHHAILCAMCQQNIPNKFNLAHLLIFTYSHSHSHTHQITIHLKLAIIKVNEQ